jgi:hypothetical protein
MDFFLQCAAMTIPLVQRKDLRMAYNSWALDLSSAEEEWNSNVDSMLTYHEANKASAEEYSALVETQVKDLLKNDLQCNLTVKWMLACGGSWAWEAANMASNCSCSHPLGHRLAYHMLRLMCASAD